MINTLCILRNRLESIYKSKKPHTEGVVILFVEILDNLSLFQLH